MRQHPLFRLSDETFRRATPAASTAALARLAAQAGLERRGGGVYKLLYNKLSSMMCWDAVLYCAWAARGVELSDSLGRRLSWANLQHGYDYHRIFGRVTKIVQNYDECMSMPEGHFVGFVGMVDDWMRHAMISLGNGMAAGNKNDYVFSSGRHVGWERLDMSRFFTTDMRYNDNYRLLMVSRKIEGQTL